VDTAARLVDWVFGRRPHSPLRQSGHANHSVNEATPKSQKCKTASVGQSTNTRFASPQARRHRTPESKSSSYNFSSASFNIHEG